MSDDANEKTLELNLLGNYKMDRKKKEDFKAAHTRLFPAKLSSSSFLMTYSLFVLKSSGEPIFGKDILNELHKMLGDGTWKPSHGTLYPLLAQLEDAGYIRVAFEKKGKKYWEITECGEEFLESQMESFKSTLMASHEFFNKILGKMYHINVMEKDEK